MTKDQYIEVSTPKRHISVSELKDQSPRTLIWGYDLLRNSFHVYLHGGMIHKVVYNSNEVILHQEVNIETADCHVFIPSKRVYPEASDYEFCHLLAKCEGIMPFTSFSETRKPRQFYGLLIEELKPKPRERDVGK